MRMGLILPVVGLVLALVCSGVSMMAGNWSGTLGWLVASMLWASIAISRRRA